MVITANAAYNHGEQLTPGVADTIVKIVGDEVVAYAPWSKTRSRRILKGVLGTDDAAVIQAGIDAIPTRGGRIYVEPGIYTLTNYLTISKNGIEFEGAYWRGAVVGGYRGATVFKMANAANLTKMMQVTGWSNHVHCVTFDGVWDQQTGGATEGLLYINGGDNCIKDICSFNSYYRGVKVTGHAQDITNVAVEFAKGVGWDIVSVEDSTFINCHVSECSGNYSVGFYINGNTHHNRFIGTKACLNNRAGWVLDSTLATPVTLNSFIGCISRNNDQHGFSLLGASRNIFDGCIINDNGQDLTNTYSGISLASSTFAGSVNNIVADCQICSTSLVANKHKYNILESDVAQNFNQYHNNGLSGAVTAQASVLGPNSAAKMNMGYISRGEIRTYSGSIATLTQDAFNSLDNPFGQAVALLALDVYVSTAATATSPNIDCGIGSSATTDYTTLFDDLPGETIGFYNSAIATPGIQTVPQLWASGSGNRYLNMSIKGAAATGMVATYVATVMGL